MTTKKRKFDRVSGVSIGENECFQITKPMHNDPGVLAVIERLKDGEHTSDFIESRRQLEDLRDFCTYLLEGIPEDE